MEPRIRVLESELADQIAAGEVVERPASVVKELVENSLDAGARRIEIDVEGGGRRLVRVVDDGEGMSPEDVRLALLRHATSKLRRLDDLFALTTMGFRGEALPSIAAVSRLTLTSRPAGQELGFRVAMEGSHEALAEPTGAPLGTQVEVRDLLHNVPARLKFLKAEPTEAAHVTETVTRLALAHPDVHFRLRHGGRVALDLPADGSLGDRVRAVLGRRLGPRVFALQTDAGGLGVRGFLLPPEDAQTTSRGIQLFVGRRFVRDRGVLHAVVMGYGELLGHGRYPSAMIFLEPPPGSVDVNVHPQKLEVRFARPADVTQAVRRAVAQALADTPWLAERPPQPVSVYAVTSPASPLRISDVAERYAVEQERNLFAWGRNAAPAPEPPPATGFFGGLRYLGQLDRTYLVCEAPGELILIDQHAAHERIAFARLRAAHAAHAVPTQRLLFPRGLDLDDTQAAAAAEHQQTLAGVGFDLAHLGGARWALSASPAELADDEVVPTVLALLGELAEHGGSRAAADRVDAVLATIACHSVVRAGDVLGVEEARALLAGMDAAPQRGHCPHGRPVLLRMGIAELARRFGRT